MRNTSITTKPKPFCFVLMPFDKSFSDVYKLGIVESCKKAGAYCERVDEQTFEGSIIERIYNQISKADIVIADMTGKNPNVFYEVGYAHALGKSTILLTKSVDDIPFDLKHYSHIIYDSVSQLKDELLKKIKYLISHPNNTAKEEQLNLEVYVDNKCLSKEVVVLSCKDYFLSVELVIHNQSELTYFPNDLRIGIITSLDFELENNATSSIQGLKISSGKQLFMLNSFKDIVFPSLYISERFYFISRTVVCETVYIRIFSSMGFRDYPLRVCLNDILK